MAPTRDDSASFCHSVWDVLIPARAAYQAEVSPHYDEVFWEVSQKVERTGSLGKTEISALIVWKRLSAQTRWVTRLMSLPDSHVRAVTERAVASVRDLSVPRGQAAQAGRGAISGLPGFRKGDAIASAILTSAAPTRMAVYDRHVQRAIDDLGLNLSDESGRYGRYMDLLETLLKNSDGRADGWTARDVDTALYWTGKNTQ
ncbi:hypothetical protein M3765_24090 [Streptomyces thermoviolaceus]|uniref:hypothetical protein n=1 Tax=Streptomyces thermoviolaceus TaxID=1952 RepID=UPI002040CDFB|nr:hypothetical protein [Streptomyces thermoviolaceus]MCM3267024.1 hypothetical protein [Streptomyces thermoviolaceus]